MEFATSGMENLTVAPEKGSSSSDPLNTVMELVAGNTDTIFQSGADMFSKLIAKKVMTRNESLGKAAYFLTNYAVLELAENIFNVGSGFAKARVQ